jgi:3-phenylpropionate/trans-cinnamate dioxygenase ferredoxin reductase subunit
VNQTSAGVVVAGAGAAGHSAARTLRQEGYTGPLTVLHHEAHAPYNRTLVNKAVLQGLLTAAQVALPSLDDLEVHLVRAGVQAIDPEASALVLDNGERLPYSTLVAATGSTPRPHSPHLGEAARLVHIHTVDDAARIRDWFRDDPGATTVTLLGAGFIGAETASYLADAGAAVHLVSRPAVPLAGALGERIARRVTELHAAHVTTHFGRQVRAVSGGADSVTVTLDDGHVLESDLAVVAHGTVSASAWTTDNERGIAVDDRLRAADFPSMYAAGSVALHTARTGHSYRIDHWDAASGQGAHAARTLLHDHAGGEDPGPYVPSTGFTLNLYRHAIAAYGIPLPGAVERPNPTGSPDALLTTFHEPVQQAMTAAAAFGASRELLALRGQLERP